MSIDTRVKGYVKVFGDWTLHETIGKGSNGKTAVFRVTRNNRTYQDNGAMKVVNIMESSGKKAELSKEFLQNYQAECDDRCKKAENELSLMNLLGSSGNIVNYHDHRFEDWEDEYSFGTDLLIRMDLLESLDKLKKKKTLDEQQILKIGIDISNALICCHEKGILHRDIKPDNIFYNEYMYMLGDFGISKMVESMNCVETRTGTEAYAAPEQFQGGYDNRVDIYSLGLTLYELANYNRLPFAKTPFVGMEEVQLRINGKRLPSPEGVSKACGDVILKACEYKPENRYQTAMELKLALEGVLQGDSVSKQADMEEDMYGTKPALKSQVSEVCASKSDEYKAYETEPALKSQVSEVLVNQADVYETQPAISISQPIFDVEEVQVEIQPVLDVEEVQAEMPVISYEEVKTETQKVHPMEQVWQKPMELPEEVPMFDIHTNSIDMVTVGREYCEKQEYVKAAEWYRKAVSVGNTEAMYELGVCFINGTGVMKDISEALQLFTDCATKSQDSWIQGLAEFKLGQIYENEFGKRKDRKIAEEWYRKSAEHGNPYAMKRFYNGKFIKKSIW